MRPGSFYTQPVTEDDLPPLSRRALHRAGLALALACLPLALTAPPAQAQSAPRKVLRYAFNVAESTFDPAQISDLYSRVIAGHIFEAPLAYDYLARPALLVPRTAAALPEVSDDFRTFTFRLRPGIHFADDPAFGGRPRELTAHDYVYSIKRHYDPRWKSPSLYVLENAQIIGMDRVRRAALEGGTPFDYDREVEGLRALDRYTFRIRLAKPAPRFVHLFADHATMGALAREVVEAHGDRVGEHPVGTGPFRLVQWRRSSFMALERNPRFREITFDARPAPDDAEGQALLRRLRGKRLPLLDRVEVSIIQESQPRWLAFLNGEIDLVDVPLEFAQIAMPHGRLAPHLAKRGIRMTRDVAPDITVTYFQMEHPVVGGYTPEKVALRRAISLAYDVDEEIRQLRRGQAVPAQGPIPPLTFGYDPDMVSEMSEFSRAKARALLDMYGYVDRNGDGWREQPDGQPLVLELASGSDLQARQFQELWKKHMDAIGVQMRFRIAQWPEQLKLSRAGKLMMWGVGYSATTPDGEDMLSMAYGPNKGSANHARFELAQFDRLYERIQVLPDGEERARLMREASRLMIAYMPYKVHTHRIRTALAQPWVHGYRPHPFARDFWQYVDVTARDAPHGPDAPEAAK